MNAPTTQFGASTTSWIRRSHGDARDRVGLLAVEAVALAEESDRRANRLAGRLHQVGPTPVQTW